MGVPPLGNPNFADDLNTSLLENVENVAAKENIVRSGYQQKEDDNPKKVQDAREKVDEKDDNSKGTHEIG